MTKYKGLLLIFIVTLGKLTNAVASEECSIDYNKYKLKAPVDCVSCQNDITIPADEIKPVVNKILNFVTESNEHDIALRKLKVMEHFLSGKENSLRCSNYKSLTQQFKNEFQKYVSLCEKGPDLLNSRKAVCDWVLSTYSRKVTDSFYAYWSEIGSNGEAKIIPGKHLEDLESPIRAHELWCRQVKKNYKDKIFLDCGSVTSWVAQFNLVKKISESVRRDLERQEEAAPTEASRNKSLQEACKFFDKNPATTFTKDLYLACIVSGD